MTWPARLTSFVLLLALVLMGLAGLDALTGPVSQAEAAAEQPSPPAAAAASATRARVFVLLLDSLRFETATSASLMPELSRLREHGVHARVTPTRDAVTVPCVRAAFTGRDRTRVLGFITNFLRGNAGIESLFTQLAAAGRRGAVYSDGVFDQFGQLGLELSSNGEGQASASEPDDERDVDDQHAAASRALADYAQGKHDLVVMHVTYTDHVAHQLGTHAPLYAQRYGAADALVALLDRAIPASDTLVVMGDHGHDELGRHELGLDVPTFALYRGPRFAAATDLDTISVRDHRYLMGYALGLSLPADYSAGRHPQALLAAGPLAADYARPPPMRDTGALGVPRERHWPYFWSVLAVAVLTIAWMLLTAARTSDLRGLRAWWPGNCLWLLTAALASCGLGASFLGVRDFVHEPSYRTLTLLWIACFGAAATVTRRRHDLRVGWALVIAPLVLSFPTVYRYGAPAAMGPAWFGWLLCTGVGAGTAASDARPSTDTTAAHAPSWWFGAGLLALLLTPFAALDSSYFRFDEWVLWPVHALSNGWMLLALAAKLLVFVEPRRPRGVQLCGLAAALLLTAAQLGVLPVHLQLAAGLVLLAGALGLRARADSARSLALVAVVAGALLLHHATVRVPENAYYWQDCLLAALVLSARLARGLPAEQRGVAWAFLLFFAFFAAGWVSFAWTVHQLEWGFLYDWLSAGFVEQHVALLFPLILGRYVLPLVAARRLLARELSEPAVEYPHGLTRLLVGGKLATLVLWTYGIAYVNVTGDVYMEAAQETGIAAVLWAGLL